MAATIAESDKKVNIDEMYNTVEVNIDGGEPSKEPSKQTLKRGVSRTVSEVKLKTDRKYRIRVASVAVFAVFVDILGTALVMPALPSLCAYAEGGPIDAINNMGLSPEDRAALIKETISPHAFKDPKPPVKYSLSMNLVNAVMQVGSAFGSFLFGQLSDRIGCVIPMKICLAMGLIGYLIIYASGIWYNSYYLFALGITWNNFFGNTLGVAQVYVRGLFEEGTERDTWVSAVLGMGLVGGSIGALVVTPFATSPKNGENYFLSVWLAFGMTVIALVLVHLMLVNQTPKTNDADEKKGEKKEAKTPVRAARILKIVIIAAALDSAGDEGTRMARGTILSAVFPEWSTTERQNYLLLGMIVVLILALVLLGIMRLFANLGSIAVFGCACTLATQLILIIEWNVGPFIAIWSVGKLFGFLSTFGSGFIVQEIAPKSQLGYWCGLNDAAINIASAICPLIFASIYDEVGNVRGQEMLVATACVSLLATLVYVPLIWMLPKPPPKAKEEKDAVKDLSEYEQMSDDEFRLLPMHIVDKVQEKAIEEGRTPRSVLWGKYENDVPHLQRFEELGSRDFKYYKDQTTMMLTNEELLLKAQADIAKAENLIADQQNAKDEMGAWIAGYLNDAGYLGWESQATLYKAMIMNAFPPIDELNNKKPDYGKMAPEEWENAVTKFLRIMDAHLAQTRSHLAPKSGVFSIIFKKR